MTKRLLIPVLLMVCFFTEAIAQVPSSVQVEATVGTPNFNSLVCPIGVTAAAGTSNQILFPSAQSNDLEFLCLGDSMEIDHLGGQSYGDPDPSTAPGMTYAFYNCQPTVSGPDLTTILTDPCHITNPAPNPGGFWSVQSNIDIDGNATFFNEGALQAFFNSGDPIELFFAPVTVDDFATAGYETDGVGGPAGPCIHANVNDAFRVVYLNAITGSNIDPTANGTCGGSFVAEGGLPEFDNSNYSNITVTLSTNPAVTGQVANAGTITHGETVSFTVPQPGIYNVVVEDGKSCAASFTVDMSACSSSATLVTTAGDMLTPMGSLVCVPVMASGFTDMISFQYTINYDPAVLFFDLTPPSPTTINPVSLPPVLDFNDFSPGTITINWFDQDLIGLTLNDGDILYEICFSAIGADGTSSPITFSGNPTPVEASDVNGVIDTEFNEGSVTIGSSSITLTFTSCSTVTDMGSFTVSATGGSSPYSVGWLQQGNPGNSGTTTIPDGFVGNLVPGIYQVVVTDATGAAQTGTVTILDLDPLFTQTTFTNPDCPDGSNGSVTVNFGGGVAPYEIDWNTGAMNVSVLNNLPLGSYSVTVTDNQGCTSSSSQTLNVPSLTLDNTFIQHITCVPGGNTGALTVEAGGGTPPFTYSWTTGATSPSITDLAAGNYCVTATDSSPTGCNIIACYDINEPLQPVITSFDSVSVFCPNDMIGELTVNVTPGNSPIDSYLWDDANNQNTQTATGLGAGTYSVTVTDQDGCSTIGSATLYAPSPLTIDITIQQPTCPLDANGVIQLSITGSTEPYAIQWENGSSLNVQPALTCDSTYAVTISDANNCETIVENIEMICPDAVIVTVDPTTLQGVNCFDGIPCDGSVTVIGSGGTAGTGLYNFTWSSGETFSNVTESTAIQLCQGIQTVIVDDGDCPSLTTEINIPAPPQLVFDQDNSIGTPVSCFGEDDGAYLIQATGGTPGYTYQWTDPAVTGPMIDNVTVGSYVVTTMDANGCTATTSVQVTGPEVLVADIDLSNTLGVTCAGGDNGQVAVSWTGGNAGTATYTWDPNVSITSTASDLTVGTYSVTVTDKNGCSDVVQHTISQPDPIGALFQDPAEPLCNGEQTVVTIDSAFGGSSLAHTFSVDYGPRQFDNAAIPILAGTHTIQVYDTLGCFTEYTIVVDEPLPVFVDLGQDTTIQLGDSLRLSPSIGSVIPIDMIFWDPLDYLRCLVGDSLCKRPWVSPLETTTYELTVIDTNGCVGTDQIVVDIDKNRNVFIPNAFSPNGDGVNDVFKIYTGPGVANINYFQVFDRWGEKLYQDENFLPADFYLEGWDGRFNGKEMNNGVYIFLAQVVFVDGVVLLYRGDVTLIR